MRWITGEPEVAEALGYLGANGVLYCSVACACEDDQPWAVALDLDEYDAIANEGQLAVEALCPVCGGDYVVAWPEEPER
jgi:hypothetical protein